MFKKYLFLPNFIQMQIILIGIGGFLGAISRFLLSRFVNTTLTSFPYGTLVVNILGSFFLALILYGLSFEKQISINFRDFLAIGFMGSFTTMSAFSYETMRLIELGQVFPAVLNVVLNIVLCLLAVFLGRELALIITR